MIRVDTALQLDLTRGLICRQPVQSLFCAFIGWKNRIKNCCNAAVVDNKRQPFNQGHGIESKCGKFERMGEI
jgi:hypothetical protein